MLVVRSRFRAAARLTAVFGLLVLCSGATVARPAPSPALPLRLAALDPGEIAAFPPFESPTPRSVSRGPFGLVATDSGARAERWRILQPTIGMEGKILAACRTNPAICPAAAAKFITIIDAARARTGRARVGEVNRAVNLAIRWTSDLAQYGVPDLWASPLTTFASGAGDCEDYAIAKYVALRDAGMSAADLRLVVVRDRRAHQDHMVAAARVSGHWLILDNRTMRLVADNEVPDLAPLFALGGEGEVPAPAVAAAPKAQPPAQAWNTAGLTVAL
jgi:predicted transglutaminase-like cysteine proteinase